MDENAETTAPPKHPPFGGPVRLSVPDNEVEVPDSIVEPLRQHASDEEVVESQPESQRIPPGGSQLIHWRSLSDAILFTLIIAGPTMLWAEMWRGKPMIDQ